MAGVTHGQAGKSPMSGSCNNGWWSTVGGRKTVGGDNPSMRRVAQEGLAYKPSLGDLKSFGATTPDSFAGTRLLALGIAPRRMNNGLGGGGRGRGAHRSSVGN